MAVVPCSPLSIRFHGHFCLLPKYACLPPSYSLFHPPFRSFSSTPTPHLRQVVRASSAVTLETEAQTQSEEGSEIDLFACPVCYEPLVRKGPSEFNLAAIYRSGFKCRKCNKTYSSDKVLKSYIPYILQKSKDIKAKKKVVKLHTLSSISYSSSVVWESINLEHPSTFETLAMDTGLKKAIIEDMDRFVRRKDFYRKVGKAWKRGYLLHGPPGTGKSSLIAAMANYLRFDIYDLELANIKRDSDLRKLLLRTANRSILVIEDIDCSVELPDRKGHPVNADGRHREPQFTLSGLLNFIDGLWSSCGDERIIIFTTNNKDKLDPALLRPGRMDMHIFMSYLTTDGFRTLATNYLNINYPHGRFEEIEELIGGMNITPAEVAEELMKSDDPEVSLGGLAQFLNRKRKKMDDAGDDDDGSKDEECNGADESHEGKRLKLDSGKGELHSSCNGV